VTLRALIVVPAALALAGCGGGNGEAPEGLPPPTEARPPVSPADTTPGEPVGQGRVLVQLEEREGSGLSGTAELTADGDTTSIVITLDDAQAIPDSAYLQEGDCTAVRAEAAEVLALFVEGRSETIVETSLSQLVNGRFAITVYAEATDDLQRPDACGEIRRETG